MVLRKFLAVAAAAVLSLSSTVVLADEDDAAVAYNKDQFASKVPEQDHFVMFYAPWCGHCKRLHPTWGDLAKNFNEKGEVTIARVDCTVETALCSDHDVTGYPTLKYFKKGSDDAEKYRGQRDLTALGKFVNQKLGKEAAEEVVSKPDPAVADKGLYVLSERNFAASVATGDHFVKFYAPWCGHCQKLAPTWDDLAKDFSDGSVKIAKLDCTTAQSVCQDNEVKGYPTLAYYRNGKKVETYRGARTLSELKDFVKSMTEASGGAAKGAEKDKVPTESGSPVAMLTVDNFADTIKEGVTFVKFFAPWCGHCKRLAPTWDELAEKYKGNDAVTIAKVDCTSDENKNKELCNKEGVNGFPTLNIYKDGKKAEEFNGKRGLDDLAAFVDKHAGDKKKDEL